MIKELAIYEKALDKVQCTEDTLRRTLSFADNHAGPPHTNSHGYAKTLLLRLPVKPEETSFKEDKAEEVVAMAMYFNNYSTW